MAKQSDPDLHAKIVSLCERGDELVNQENFAEAVPIYSEAWSLLPEPKNDWEASTWILSALGDAYFFLRNHEHALKMFLEVIQSPEGLGNPFIHLRLGECYYELGDTTKAGDELTRAYMAGGKELFAKEDAKYFALVSRALKPPVGKK